MTYREKHELNTAKYRLRNFESTLRDSDLRRFNGILERVYFNPSTWCFKRFDDAVEYAIDTFKRGIK